ncbi:MAG: 23S rRNA (pseudouridine(1915)-N(3))-methyltransferase RlmH [Clostridia bacterium]|nr:23S rRNA (pseudouridine(1915)-N(3))-methyltransferase RlmH [Clostridia bacterium]NCC68589.1 23S rRNA (pseudouridine(1915)-N(3))-methyltransferase RlmH [Clostridia bacterium]
MLLVKLVCVGRMREKHYSEAFAEYAKRLGAFCKFETAEIAETRLPEDPSENEIAAALLKEAAEIGKQIPKGAYIIAMCIEGESLSSEALAKLVADRSATGVSKLCFIVGGSFGLHESVKKAADMRLSMSMMTFPHHLARVMLAEQIYRAFSINGSSRYHK